MIKITCSLILFLIICSCCQTEKKPFPTKENLYLSTEDTLYLPFDTAKVLSLYQIETKKNEVEKFKNEDNPELEDRLDTLILTYHQYACDCPNWRDDARTTKENAYEMSPDNAYYLEAASKSLHLSPRLSQCTVRLIGRSYKERGLPKNTGFTDPHPPAGNIFRYYAYELILPAVIWGPYYHTGEREIPSDPEEVIMSTHLILKE